MENSFQSQQAQEIIQYVREAYGAELEFLWPSSPQNAIWRNPTNRKWFAVLLTISKHKLGFETEQKVEIIDLRFPKNEALDFAQSSPNIYPGYHMNKNNWIAIILDGSVPTTQILALLDQSYMIAAQK